MAYVLQDNSSIVLSQLDANAQSAMKAMETLLVESVQTQMLYGYQTPHGPDGHTEIVDTGKLFDSIQAKAEKQSQNLYAASVGTDVGYAGFVHDGTSKLAGRPFITDGVMNAQDDIQAVFSSELPNGLK